MLVFDSIEISPPPPTKRRALAPNNKGTKAEPASKPKMNARESRPARKSAAQGTPEEERMSIASGNPQDSADESDEEQPVKGPGSSARKRSRVSSSSDESHRSSTTNTSGDDLPLPASIAADNKRLKAKRETTLNNAALRSPRKTKSGKVRIVDTKRKLTALSQGVRDRRSEDEESDEEDFVVDDDDAIIYDTTTTEEEDEQPPPLSKKQKKAAAKRKGKERAVSDDEDEEDRPTSTKKKEREKGKSRKQVQRDLLVTDSEDEQPTRSASKRKHGKKKGGREDDDEDDEEEEPVQRKKRRRRQRRRLSESEEESNSDDGIDDGPEDLEILDEETVIDQKFRTLKTNESKFASLKAARDRESARATSFVTAFRVLAHLFPSFTPRRSKGEPEGDRARLGG